MKVLVVQDSVLADLGLEDEIRNAGHTVIGSIERSAAAIHLARAHNPEVALIDFDRISREEACDLAVILRSEFSTSVIAMTSHFERTKACVHALLGVLMKPFSFDQVPAALCKIERVLQGHAPHPASLMIFEAST
jgi:DNA-binding NarL/FixJ family response regulator